METFYLDLRHSLRLLLKSPSFALVAILTLALGIGANTAIFSVFNGMLWRPLPVKDPSELVVLAVKGKNANFFSPLSYPDIQDYSKLTNVFSNVSGLQPNPVNLGTQGRPERGWADAVSGNYFAMLGIQPALGRFFAPDEGQVVGKDPVIVLNYKFWQQHFAGDPLVLGQTVQLNQHPFTIIGVAPESFRGTYYFFESQMYVPLTELPILDDSQREALTSRRAAMFRVLARLQPGVTYAQAASAVQDTDARLARDYPESHKDISVAIFPELSARPEPGFGGFMSTAVSVFMVLAGLVLLIASANVANLILTRANGRRKELATRTALGATRFRMIRQLLTESIVLACLGGVAGLLLARWVGNLLTSFRLSSEDPIRLFDVHLDARIFAFSFAAAVLTGVVAGLIPALQASRTNLVETLKAGGRSGDGSAGHSRFRSALVITQVAVSVLLLACAGFFLRSLRNSAQVDMGFRIDHRLMLNMDLKLQGYKEDRAQIFYEQLQTRVSALSGIRQAAISAYIPMGFETTSVDVWSDGPSLNSNGKSETAFNNIVQPGYFQTLGTQLIAGREFTVADSATAPRVAVVNATFAQKLWPDQDPLGRTFRTSKDGPPIQVVGLTRTGKYLFLYETPQPYVYFPMAQQYSSTATLTVYTQGDPVLLLPAIREQISALDPALPVFDVKTMETHVQYGKPLLPARIGAILVGSFGFLGLVLATVGVYGVVSYSVSQQTQEIGIRTALGAQRSTVMVMILKRGMSVSLIGIAVGLVLAVLVFQGLHSLLFGVNSSDLPTLAAVSILLTTVAFAATAIPALRATRVDPVIALRSD